MANLLNFNPNREINFSSARELQFDLNRDLGFNSNRDLTFQPNRDLGFGKRGVLFRGYACANCGAIVSADARSCDECGAVFEEPEVKGAPMKAVVKTSAIGRTEQTRPTEMAPASAPAPAPAPPAERSIPGYPPPPAYVPPPAIPTAPTSGTASRFCPSCGARSWQGDAFCWNCGTRFTASPKGEARETIQLPPKKAKKVVKDWQETGKSLEEYAEEK